MSSSLIRRATLGLALSVAASALWALPTRYHLQDLGAGTLAAHINARGMVAGTDTSTGHHLPVIWTPEQMQWLNDPFPGGDALWINESGVVVGTVEEGYGSAAYWTKYGVFEDIGAAQGLMGTVIASINDKGDCIFWGAADAESSNLLLLPKCNLSKQIFLGWDLWGAAINGNDQVALTDKSYQDRQHAYLYSDGALTDLGMLTGYTQSIAADLNGDAHVVGTAADAAYDQREGFFWNGKKMRRVGTLGGERSEANAINGHDVVVGSAQTSTGKWHAFVRDMRAVGSGPQDLGKMLDSSGKGWSLDSAVSINKSGQIIVRGTAPRDSNPRSAVLTPLD